MAKRGQRGSLRRTGLGASRPHRRGIRFYPAVLLVALLASLVILSGFFLSTIADRDWHAVATVNGVTIDRSDLRSRIALDAFVARLRADRIRAAAQAGRLTTAAAAALDQGLTPGANPAVASLDALIDDELVRQGATALGVAPAAADVGAELVTATTIDARLHVRSVTLTAPPPPQAQPADPNVADALRAELLPSAIVATATSAGWTATGADTWLPADGPPATGPGASSGTPSTAASPSLLVAARAAAGGAILGPFTDEVTGAVTTGLLVEVASDGPSAASARQEAVDSGIDAATLDAWAQAQQLRRAVLDHLQTAWTTTPIEQVRAAELVLGARPDGGNPGPYVELSHLVLKQFAMGAGNGSPTPDGAGLAAELRTLPMADRLRRFAELVRQANAPATTDLLARSGEIGILTANNLTAAISSLAFAPATRSGDILGPINTAEGDELFLIEARYAGALDDATVAALIAARDPATDFPAMAGRIDSAFVARARSGPWRGRPEFAASDPAASLTAVPAGVEADPVVIDGQLIVARVLEHRMAPASGALADRLRLDGFGDVARRPTRCSGHRSRRGSPGLGDRHAVAFDERTPVCPDRQPVPPSPTERPGSAPDIEPIELPRRTVEICHPRSPTESHGCQRYLSSNSNSRTTSRTGSPGGVAGWRSSVEARRRSRPTRPPCIASGAMSGVRVDRRT